MSDVEAVIVAFVEWAREAHPSVDADPGIVRGVLMLAGSKPVTKKLVAECVDLASEAGNDDGTLAAIAEQGELLLEFQAQQRGGDEPRGRAPVVNFTKRAGSKAEGEPTGQEGEVVEQPGRPSRKRRIRPAFLVAALGLFIVAIIAGAGLYLRAMRDSPNETAEAPPRTRRAASSKKPAPRGSPDLDHLGLEQPLPSGWLRDGDGDGEITGPLATIKTSLVVRRAPSGQPAHEALIGTTELPETLATNLPLSDELHLRLVHFIEYHVARETQRTGIYRRGSCDISVDPLYGHRTATCSGDALGPDATSAVHTYVRLEPERAVVAVFVAHDAPAGARAEADRLFEGLR